MEKGKLATKRVVLDKTFSVWGLGALGFLTLFFFSPEASGEEEDSAGELGAESPLFLGDLLPLGLRVLQ